MLPLTSILPWKAEILAERAAPRSFAVHELTLSRIAIGKLSASGPGVLAKALLVLDMTVSREESRNGLKWIEQRENVRKVRAKGLTVT